MELLGDTIPALASTQSEGHGFSTVGYELQAVISKIKAATEDMHLIICTLDFFIVSPSPDHPERRGAHRLAGAAPIKTPT
ncbi:hypothetical protein [Stenotrophomonas sp.]|uniref:hypothetical protein n=1 Tax=Stenotrophomonas sp. TaxID=69392 RepID=UPI002FCB2639